MRSIWAVARNTISQALHMKVAVIFIVLLAILLPLMGIAMGGDGTLKGKLQTFISYGLSLTSFLLCLLTIAVSCHTLTDDIKRKQIHMVLTKPIRRYELICGKFLGIVILDAALLALFSAVIYGFTIGIPKVLEFPPHEKVQADYEFFTARASVEDPVDRDSIKQRADEIFADRQQKGEIPKDLTISRTKMLKQSIMAELIGGIINVEPGTTRKWVFEDIPPLDPDELLFVQYKIKTVTPSIQEVDTKWAIGDDRKAIRQLKTEVYSHTTSDPIRITREFKVPASVVAEDGYVTLNFFNDFSNNTTVMPEEVKLLYRAGTFTGNYVRVVAVIFSRLVFLAALGVSVSTWLSFPVAILVCVVVFFTGTINGFIYESIMSLSNEAIFIYKFTIRPILWLLPVFDGDYNPTPYMVSAEFLKLTTLANIFSITGVLKSGILILLGMLIFTRREIAKVTV